MFAPHLIINEENFSPHILKHNWLGEDEAKDKDVIQQAGFAFKEQSVDLKCELNSNNGAHQFLADL
jgi:hypothetical protein